MLSCAKHAAYSVFTTSLSSTMLYWLRIRDVQHLLCSALHLHHPSYSPSPPCLSAFGYSTEESSLPTYQATEPTSSMCSWTNSYRRKPHHPLAWLPPSASHTIMSPVALVPTMATSALILESGGHVQWMAMSIRLVIWTGYRVWGSINTSSWRCIIPKTV